MADFSRNQGGFLGQKMAGNYGNQGNAGTILEQMLMGLMQQETENLFGGSNLDTLMQGQTQQQPIPIFRTRTPRQTYWHETHPPQGGGGGGMMQGMMGGGGQGGGQGGGLMSMISGLMG